MEYLIKELMTYYFNESIEKIESVPFGLTNYSQVLTINNKKYVARIYDKQSKNLEKLKFEIELTTFLEQGNLSFKVPGFLTASTGEKYVKLSNGQLGSMMYFIEGEVPDLTQITDAREYGRAVGELSVIFKDFKTNSNVNKLQFHDIYNLHPLCNERTVYDFFNQPPFEIDRNQRSVLTNAFQTVIKNESLIDTLPKQIIHHDLLIFNLLIDRKRRTMNGVLDFDFASYDVRALELAICINHLFQINDSSLPKLQLFLDEYAQYMTLTEEEIECMPFLMKMYYVTLITIYIGQYYAGQEVGNHFRFILNQLVSRTEWLKQNEHGLLETLKLSFKAK
ncbi:phosphotransferase [Paenibacillus dokdonensis]|uniref:phosphotransferase n=1 Tax=Paenibacillus dokdonensis TaxID=2567944 RepID=UPI0010A8BC9C|nr:phosphotransferase [Paenibacillus dokdonensis]